MNLGEIHRIYFIGIGGIGMSALARHFHQQGKVVTGYDKTSTTLTRKLESEGMAITYTDSEDTLDASADLVIYTPAIPSNHVQFNYYSHRPVPVKKRSEVLGMICNEGRGLAVAGSHGKTSTSAILNHILQTAEYDCGAFMGGISLNYDSNYVAGSEWIIAEADEFDRSFHRLFPIGGIITSVDTDHLDVYGNYEAIVEAFEQFGSQVQDVVIHHTDVPEQVVPLHTATYSYGWDTNADYYVSELKVHKGCFHYAIQTPTGKIDKLKMQGGGRHNVENSIAATALARNIGISDDVIRQAISTYKGVQRRFEIHIQEDDLVYIDDYAHHPKEIEVTLQTARELYKGRKLTVVFQPHLYSRTRDLAVGLADALNLADEVILLDIYPARELPIEGISSEVIYNLLKNKKYLAPKNQVLTLLNTIKPNLLITMGAGDIDTLVPEITSNRN